MATHSIIIPTFNRPLLLRRAVMSAIAAAGPSGEVIVVDDGSQVPAKDALSDITFERLRFLRNATSLANGGSPSRNRGADAADAAVLFFLDDDDEYLEGYCAAILSETVQSQAAFGFCARQFATAKGGGMQTLATEKRALRTGVIPAGAHFKEKTFPFSAGFWLTKDTFEMVGPMETSLSTNSDTEYTCRLYASDIHGWYSQIPGVRIYAAAERPAGEAHNVTRRTQSCDRADAFRYIAEKHADFLNVNPSAARFIYTRLAKHSMRAGRQGVALAAARKVSPWYARIPVYFHVATSLFKSRAE